MKKLIQEFKAFINKGNALALAIGVIIGSSFTAIVTAINQKIISPLIGALCGDADLSDSLITILNSHIDEETGEMIIDNAIYWGAFIQACIDFLLTAIILFAIFKIASAVSNAAKKAAEKAKEAFEKLEEEKEGKTEEEQQPTEVVPAEPTIDEKQLALLEAINENLLKLNNNSKQ